MKDFKTKEGTEVWIYADSILVERNGKIKCVDYWKITDENVIHNAVQNLIYQMESETE